MSCSVCTAQRLASACCVLLICQMTIFVTPSLALTYLTFEVDATRGSIQRSGHWVGPLHVLIKPKNLPEATKAEVTLGEDNAFKAALLSVQMAIESSCL